MLQIIGFKNNQDTRNAIRYCKERRIDYQFVDLSCKSLSVREWKSIIDSTEDKSTLIDTSSKYYKSNGYQWREYDPVEEAVSHPEMLRVPILRFGQKAFVGFNQAFIQENI